MKRSFFSTLLLAGVLVFSSACTDTDQAEPLPQLETVGFAGSLPDGRTFGSEVTVSHGIVSSSSSNQGSFISHIFSIEDSAGISLKVELPYVKFSNAYLPPSESADLQQIINEHYPLQVVKEKLSAGDKLILSSQHPDMSKAFRIQMADQRNYLAYTTEQHLDQGGSYLRVKQVLEGQETDPVLGTVKTIDITFDVDVKLYPSDWGTTQPGKLKGLLRMKYREK
jgi:hypothetical protein